VRVGAVDAARHDRDDAVVGQSERSGQFGRLGESNPSGRSRAGERQPAAVAQPVGDQPRCRDDLPGGRTHGGDDALLAVQQPGDDLLGWQEVQLGTLAHARVPAVHATPLTRGRLRLLKWTRRIEWSRLWRGAVNGVDIFCMTGSRRDNRDCSGCDRAA
jgi:hypothetical protein